MTRSFVLKIATVCLSLAWLTLPASAQSIQPIYSFTNGPAHPYSSLVQGPDGNFYGTTYSGGAYFGGAGGNGNGTVFRVTTNGVLTALHSFSVMVFEGTIPGGELFTNADGANPYAGLVLGPDGNFYGTTSSGGIAGYGTVFEITTNGVLTTLYSFSAPANDGIGDYTNFDGANPYAGLALGTDGNFYGTTFNGGNSGNGTVFKVTTNGVLTSLYSFSASVYNNDFAYTNSDGAGPYAGLTLGPDGNFYGTTQGGGSNDDGTVFQITTNGMLTSLAAFDYDNGSGPEAGLMLGPDGNFYGTTCDGGDTGNGVVFQITTAGALTTLYSFSAISLSSTNTDGANPYGGLTLGPDGNFYGTTTNGGDIGYGTVFQITTNGMLTTLHSFGSPFAFPDLDGANPRASLTLGNDGNLYGTTYRGGTSDSGAVFQMTTNGTVTALASFGCIDGANPYASLTLGPDGNFYGTTSGNGGANGWGTVFTLSTNGSLTTQARFAYTNGATPLAGLTLGPDGNFYSATYGGGSGLGTVFRVTTNGALATLFTFGTFGLSNGLTPKAGLTLGPDGNFYGTTLSAGSGPGTVFRITTNGTLTTLYTFSATTNNGAGKFTNADGAYPNGGLTLGPDGNFYGTACLGGSSGFGTVFKITTNGFFTPLASFARTNGANPYAGLTLGPGGNLYGTTTNGGYSGYGTVFEITTDGTLTSLASFDPTNSAIPKAALALGPDGNFYGTTSHVGFGFRTTGYGTVFMLTTNGLLTTLAGFDSTNGANPATGLTLGPDGNFYGTTPTGGSAVGLSLGVIYRLNLPPSIITQPSNQIVAVGSDASFTVILFGTAPFTYQWLSNGTPITDATNGTLTVPDVTASSAGNYQVIITNAWGSATSSIAALTLGISPTITNQPLSETVPIGGTATFSVSAAGTPPLAYQWYFNTNTSLPGANNAALSFGPVLSNEAGQYQVIVTSPYGSATSSAAALTVLLQPNCYGISNSGSGTVTLLLASTPNSTNRLWAATNLSLPLAQWQPLSTNAADATGLFQFTDTNTGDTPAKFYILSSP